MLYITRQHGKPINSQLPFPTDDVTQSSDRITIPAETVTFNSAAAIAGTGVNALDKSPVMNLTGDKVGSYWGQAANKVIEFTNTVKFGTLTETATSASAIITDEANDLDGLFETTTGSRRYILRAIDASGDVLYGWIGDVTVSGDIYTFPIHNAVTSGAQSWVGSLANFDGTPVRIEIYRYSSSFVWTTGTVLTREVALDEEALENDGALKRYFDSLSNGDYGINYRTGSIYFKKATTGTSDTATYNTVASATVLTSSSGASTTSAAMQSIGTEDVAGADTYITIKTSGVAATHAIVSLDGANDAIISFDAGTTDHFVMKSNSVVVLDGLDIAASTAIQGKNKTAGLNYTNLNISIW